MNLYDYQEKAYQETKQAFKQGHKRVLVVAPCGWGKSYLFAKMTADTIASNQSGEILILTHRTELLKQHKNLFSKLGIDTSRIRIVSVFTEKNHTDENEKPLLIIADESHLSMAKSWQKVINHYDTYTVGLTASPCRLDNKPLGDIFSHMVKSVSVDYLIQNKRLAPFEYFAPMTVNTDNLKTVAGDYTLVELEQLMCQNFIYSDVVQSYKRIANGEQCIAYCVNVNHAKQTAEQFRKEGYMAECIYGGLSDKTREKIMEDFTNGKITILCNCGIISEGVSIDNCSVCLLLRPTQSLALNIQQSMRCMRYAPGKTAKIIDCVGNYTRHGLPNTPHNWSLTKPAAKHQNMTATGDYAIRVCPFCFKTFQTAAVCPYCKQEYPLTEREVKEKKNIELQKITQAEMEELEKQKKQKRMEVGKARTRQELIAIARERGYNMSWVWIQCKLKGIS